jgi:hypothetical protein
MGTRAIKNVTPKVLFINRYVMKFYGVRFERLEDSCGEVPVRPGLVLGYGSVSVSGIDEGLRLLTVS